MVLISGSQSATPKLLELVPQRFRDLSKFYKKDEINSLQQWIVKQPHLPKLREAQLLVFLHAADYSVEKAKDIIDNYYSLRTRAPEIFAERNPDKHLARAFKIAYFITLPDNIKSYDGNHIVILKLRDTDPAKADFVEGVKTTFALLDFTVGKYPLSKGLEIIMDMEGLALGHLTKIDFSALRVFFSFCQVPFMGQASVCGRILLLRTMNCTAWNWSHYLSWNDANTYPLDALQAPLKAVHVINTFSLINQVMAIIKPFLQVELLNKLKFYTPNEFNKLTSTYIPIESLPRDLNGTLDSLEVYQDEMFRQFQLAADWFEELESYKVDESKRLGRKRSDLNVCDGSFRKLELD